MTAAAFVFGRYKEGFTEGTCLVFNRIPFEFNMNGLTGVKVLLCVVFALAVLTNEAVASLGGGVGGGRSLGGGVGGGRSLGGGVGGGRSLGGGVGGGRSLGGGVGGGR
ncbi:hypothetical protein MRX96_039519 [Rhipicephalus microplus]